MDRFLQQVCTVLRAGGAHTILLYGSRADGTEGKFSDYDIAAFADVPATRRDARLVDGRFLDIFIHPEAVLHNPTTEHLTLRKSKIIVQRGADGTNFLGALDTLFQTGPPAIPADEIEARRTWARKMALRMRRSDIEGNFRRAWLLTTLLEDYFALRGMWYQGPKKSFHFLSTSDPDTYRAFEAGLKPERRLRTSSALSSVSLLLDSDQTVTLVCGRAG